MRVVARGKSFLLAGSPFRFRGVRRDPASELQPQLEAMTAAGYTVVSLPPPHQSEIEQATESGLRFILELNDANLSVAGVRRSVGAWHGRHALLGVIVGGAASRQLANELAVAVHDEDASLLAAWRALWPRQRECPAEFDVLLIDCELPGWDDLEGALMSSHRDVGERPLVLGTVSLSSVGRLCEADTRRMIDTALRCGVGGTIAPAPSSCSPQINRRTVRDLHADWPSISVVINAYNAAATIEECLSHCDRLDYPDLEVIVVDDGSTDATAAIAGAHAETQLVTIARSGLSAGRNVGYRSARGDLVAYLDADAYPSPEWPWYLALAALGDRVGGAGGPNVPPPEQSASAGVVARSPGGPVPQLLSPDRAKHLPGCNMAFWRGVLERLDGFDPVIEGAEDIEFEWRVGDLGYELGYHPAALVWHHRRPGLAPYLRQQRHYGRGQAILERRCPERFAAGHRVRNAIRDRQRDGESTYSVRYLTLPRPEPAWLELAHQWGMPIASLLVLTAPLALVRRKLGTPALTAAAFVGALFAIDVAAAGTGRRRSDRMIGVRARVAALRLLRPLAFRWGHLSERHELRRGTPQWPPRPADVSSPNP